ncbi:MAG: hypothetical protein IOC54_09140 [Methylobacterium sp.]|nr:hypothetical protein [Methylobacterium sp.]MCA3651987.1 hypothetical protein [Methylobacterium sp.]
MQRISAMQPQRLFCRLMATGLMALAMLVVVLQPGFAQSGKRLAFVVGLADYGATQHPTALGDAGLVAQTLKGAGFEVTEAANLNQGEFRTLFRDFSDKAMEAGADVVIAVYVSGLALQDDGDNILIPVDARLRQRNDLATEGLRIADFLRGISGLPARARIVFLDAAYQHPVLQLVADGGRGLSLADRAGGTLIGFNQSPGRAAPLPTTSYGPFAMALAEVLIEPGLPVEGMMERLRLRVHDLTQGVVTPWLLNGIAPGFVLNPGAPGVAAAVAPEANLLRERPMAQLTPEQGYARAVEIDTIAAYEEFIRAFPGHVLARRARATVAARREAAYWQRTRRANTERAYWTYLKRYPRGAHAAEAEDRLIRLSAPVAPPPSFEEVIYDDLPPPLVDEVVIYEEVVLAERWERLPPPWAGPVGFLPPPPLAIIELPPPPPPRLEERGLPVVAIAAGVAGITAAAILANRAWRRPPRIRETTFVPPPRPPREPGFGRRPVVLPAGLDPRGLTAPQVTNRPPLVRPNVPPPAPGSIPGVLNPTRPGTIPQPVPPVTRPETSVVQPPAQRPTTLPPPPNGRPVPPTAPGIRPDVAPAPPGQPGRGGLPGIANPSPGTVGPSQRPPIGTPPANPPAVNPPTQRPAAVSPPPGPTGPAIRPQGLTPPTAPAVNPPRPPGWRDPAMANPDDRRPVNRDPLLRQRQIELRPPPPQGRPMPQQNGLGVNPMPRMPPREAQPQMRTPQPQARPMPPMTRPAQPAPPPPQSQVRPSPPMARPTPPTPPQSQVRPMPPMTRPAQPAPPPPQPQARPSPPMAQPTPPTPPPAVRPVAPPPVARPAPQAPPPTGQPVDCTPQRRAAGQC